jgi:hypothetical protein
VDKGGGGSGQGGERVMVKKGERMMVGVEMGK